MQKIIPTLCFVLFSAVYAYTQRSFEVFSDNPPEFLAQMEEFMLSGQQEKTEESFEAFEALMQSGVYSEEEIKSIIFVSNQMMSMRMQANTVFRDYIDALVVIKNGVADSEQRLAEWQNVLNQILEGIVNKKTRVYTNFLKFSKKFYESGALRASQRATSWTARQSNYSVKYADKQPYVEFESTDLIAVRLKDSIQIHQTSGRYFPTSEEWIGKSGTVKWSDRFSDLGEDVYAEFPDTFRIQMNTSLYSVQNAKLKYPLYFGDKFIRGTFEDKIVSDSKDADYPKFESNKKILNIDNIGQGIYFVGGFRLNGLTVYGYGTKEKRANLKIYDDKEERLIYEGSSERVIIKRGEFLIGNDVESNIYFNQDSIYHPAVNIRFNIEDKTLQLNRIKEGNGKNPFFSSVHKMNFDAENIFVYFRKDSVEIGKRGIAFDTKKEVYFESLKFFSEGEYLRNKGISDYSAIDIIAVTSEREDTKVIDADLIASRINSKFTGENIKGELYELVAGGFIDYDDEKQIIYVKEKLLHYANANQGKVDFDPLRIMSDTEDVNATLNLKNSEISATGIRAIEFSRKQRVAILPDSSNVTIRENRDMNFDGKLFAGFSTITGKGFDFEYDRYLIDLDSVQYFDLYIPTGELDERNQPVALPLGSRIEGLNGVLLIDAPSNKSGREDIEIFPSFQSKQKSYVYYDQKEIRQGVYKRDSFYFELDKFSFNHLDKFTARDIIFPGTLYSFDIMAPFEESLIVRDEDQSLGFTHSTPEAGYALYKEKGNYMGIIDLSNRGLTGEGDLTYLGATVFSDDIVFKPYQLTASAKTFEHAENRTDEVQTPKISGLDAAIDWRPYKDSMYVQTKEKPFEVYQSAEHTLDGTLILTPGGVKGIGKLDWSKAAMNSPLFAFGANSVTADTTTLNIKAEDGTETALSTKDMNANVDFDEGQAAFEANTEKAITKLPYNRYETSINSFAWDMNAEEVRFQSDASKLGTFLSVHPDQDSLRFKGQSAFYDLKTNELQIGGIPHIVAADAFIYPDSSSVTVLPEAVITTLENAKIVADTVNQNHVINRATVNILGKRLYTASGFYEYNIGNNKQEIEFSEIKGEPVGKGKYKEKRVATRATGTVAAEDSFYIDLKTEFQGTISLSSDSKALFFDGFARLDEEKLPQRQWFRLRSEGNKEDLIIKYNEPKNQEGVPLETGFFLSKETGIAYPSMMGILAFRKDRALLPVKGRMKLDPKRDEFIFADSSKMVNLDALTGNKLVFSNKTGKIRGEGKFDIGSGLKYIDIEAAGFMNTEMVPVDSGGLMPNYQVDAEFMATVDLILPDKLLDIMVKDLRSAAFESQAINFIKEPNFYRKATSELFPSNKEIDLAIQEVNRGALNLPAKHNNHTFVFAKLPMKWNTEYQSFVTKGSKVGLVSIKGELFNYVYKGYVECRMPTNGDDRLYIYLESPTGTSYYFGFKQGILSITSSNTAFIQAAEALKAKEVILKMDDGETYEIQLVSPGISNMFINRVKAAQK